MLTQFLYINKIMLQSLAISFCSWGYFLHYNGGNRICEECRMCFTASRFLDPKADGVFKRIFGEHPHLLKSFLNGVMPLDVPIESLQYLPTEQVPRIPSLKNTIVDVKCTDQKGRVFIVEMQMEWSMSFQKRLLFGTSKTLVQQVERGKPYGSLCSVYGLGILGFVFDPDSPEWFHHYRMTKVEGAPRVLEGLELIFIELPKFKPLTWEHRKLGVLWLRFLREMGEQMAQVPQEFLEEEALTEALELSQEAGFTLGELESYDHYWDSMRVEATIQQDAFAKGERKGREEGRAEGERKKTLELARAMLAKGIDYSLIQESTEVCETELHTLKSELIL